MIKSNARSAGGTTIRRVLFTIATVMTAAVVSAQPRTPAPKDAETGRVLVTLTEYRKAMEARSVDRLAAVVDPELTVIEGIHKNAGWPDYRDNHIGPEMKDWKAFQVLDPLISEVTVSGDHAYALQQATYTITTEKDTVVLDGVESFVLRKSSDTWKIKLVHFSAKRREIKGEKK